jgi:predicted nucleic acid-binding protein
LSALVLDAGALVAVDRGDHAMIARLRAARQRGVELRTSAIVVAQVWRDPRGRQAELARLLQGVNVRPVDEQLAREAGVLLGRAGTSDAIDATVVLVASRGDRILTSDPADIARLVDVARRRAIVVGC